MKEKVIAIFDIGKTNKKVLLFNKELKLVFQEEQKFSEIKDDDGFECDNIELLEDWILATIKKLVQSSEYELGAVNFTTYGATLMYVDNQGKRLTPVYNYLKPIPENIPHKLYNGYGGEQEFCRRTASPALGMLNSGLQALWLKQTKPEIFGKVQHILHFPQYLSSLLTGKFFSEYTSIGCHTALWDFDNMKYHPWVKDEGLNLPDPVSNSLVSEVDFDGLPVMVGVGIHDSSASLAPYFSGSEGDFMLISTGTWCINMNPFNEEQLTAEQLQKDCLSYLSITQKPVKSSRLFMGHFHEVYAGKLASHFGVPVDSFKKVKADPGMIKSLNEKYGNTQWFFVHGIPVAGSEPDIDLTVFKDYNQAYHKLVIDLAGIAVDSINLVIPSSGPPQRMYITGGFARNEIFVRLIAGAYQDTEVLTSEVDNATALGAAMVVLETLDPGEKPDLNLGLQVWNPF